MTTHKFGHVARPQPTADQVGGGAQSSTEADFVLRFATVVSSSISARTGSVEYSITGIAGLNFDAEGGDQLYNESEAESVNNAEVYSAGGIIARPLPPRNIDGIEQHMDVICVSTVEGLVPLAYRDLRLKMQGGAAPGEGVIALVGYGGGFHSLTPVVNGTDPAGGGTIHVLYCPFDFDSDGVSQKAHSIILDPTPGNESIIISHANGLAITFSDQDDKALLLKNAAGDATIRVDDKGVTITAVQIVLSGGVVIGEPEFAVPLLPGVASPGSSKLFVSP